MIPFTYIFSNVLLLDWWLKDIFSFLNIPLDILTLLEWNSLHIFNLLSIMKPELNSLPRCGNPPLLTSLIILMSGRGSDR